MRFSTESVEKRTTVTLTVRHYYLKNSPTECPLFFNTHTHTAHRIEQLLQEFEFAGSALLVPVARAVISGPRGSMRGCVFLNVCARLCVCVRGHERAGSFTPQKTTRSLQVAL